MELLWHHEAMKERDQIEDATYRVAIQHAGDKLVAEGGLATLVVLAVAPEAQTDKNGFDAAVAQARRGSTDSSSSRVLSF